ncbi:hypothetical protein AC579_3064 [Pseudocercospora musae]|uniref:Uncharacterized protein n=1 Tax=Pseudocercospora musae TaxID=113226 RepID=A0A139IJW3_9PEZI|nr:hypothetical protein AC579_3064 [Pseudocercospora musae]
MRSTNDASSTFSIGTRGPHANNNGINSSSQPAMSVRNEPFPWHGASYRAFRLAADAGAIEHRTRNLPSLPVTSAISPIVDELQLACASPPQNAQRLFDVQLRTEAGYSYLQHVTGEVFDVVAQKGEFWVAGNQHDFTNELGWIWEQHFVQNPNIPLSIKTFLRWPFNLQHQGNLDTALVSRHNEKTRCYKKDWSGEGSWSESEAYVHFDSGTVLGRLTRSSTGTLRLLDAGPGVCGDWTGSTRLSKESNRFLMFMDHKTPAHKAVLV